MIVSGTGFSLDLFKPDMSMSVAKVDEWDVHYETGDFFERTTHFAYLSQSFPSSFIDSDAGIYLKGRNHEWLRGRYVAAIVLRQWLIHLTQTYVYSSFRGGIAQRTLERQCPIDPA